MQKSKQIPNYKAHFIVAGIFAIASLIAFATMLIYAEHLTKYQLTKNVWYLVLFFVSLPIAISVHVLFKSYASYTGSVWGGKLKISGPIITIIFIVYFGLIYAPTGRQKVDITIFVRVSAGLYQIDPNSDDRILLDVGQDRRVEKIGENGYVRFVGIPGYLIDKQVPVTLQSNRYRLADSNTKISLDNDVVYLDLQDKAGSIRGIVEDQAGSALVGADVSLGEAKTVTDAKGTFVLDIPTGTSAGRRVVVIDATGFHRWSSIVELDSNEIHARLESAKR